MLFYYANTCIRITLLHLFTVKNFFVLISTVIGMLLLSEAALRLSNYKALLYRAPIEIENDESKQFYIADPDLGFTIRPNAVGNARSFPHDFISYVPVSNEFGCYDDSLSLSTDSSFGLLIGDSFTFGTHSKEFGWPHILDEFTNYQTLACGVDSYGTKQELLWTKKILSNLPKKPKFIVLQYYVGNDMFDDYLHPAVISYKGQKVSRVDLAKTDFNTGQILVRDTESLAAQLKAEFDNQPTALAKSSVVYGLFEAAVLRKNLNSVQVPTRTSSSHSPSFITFDSTQRSWLAVAWKNHLENLLNFKRVCEEFDVPLFVILVPSNDQVYPFLVTEEEKTIIDLLQPNRIVTDFLRNHNIAYYDALSDMRTFADQTARQFLDSSYDLFHKVDGHFSIRGEEIFSYLVTAYLAQQNVFSDSQGIFEKAHEELKQRKIELQAGNIRSIDSLEPKIISYGPTFLDEKQVSSNLAVAFWVKLDTITPYMRVIFNNIVLVPTIDVPSGVLTFEVPSDLIKKQNYHEMYVYDKTVGVISRMIKIEYR